MSLLAARRGSANGGAGPATPTFVGVGGIVQSTANGTSINPSWHASSTTDDLGILTVWTLGEDTFVVPSGWTYISGLVLAGGSARWYYRRYTGSGDTPTVTHDTTGTLSITNPMSACIYTYRGCVGSGNPLTGGTTVRNGTTTTPTTATWTRTGDYKHLAVAILIVGDDTTWSTAPPPSTFTVTSDQTSALYGGTRTVGIHRDATNETITGVVVGTLSLSEMWRVINFALIPI